MDELDIMLEHQKNIGKIMRKFNRGWLLWFVSLGVVVITAGCYNLLV